MGGDDALLERGEGAARAPSGGGGSSPAASTSTAATTSTTPSSTPSRFRFSRSTDDELPPGDAQPAAAAAAQPAPWDDPAVAARNKARPLRPRNKGVACANYLAHRRCPIGSCPYAHVADGESRPLPNTVCMFFARGQQQQVKQKQLKQQQEQPGGCLRDNCHFFHGTKSQLRMLREAGATSYRPQDYMEVASPWAD